MASCSSSANQAGRRGWKSYLTVRNGVILGLVVLTGTGLAFGGGWGWLVAVGAAPIILSLLPCAIMCGLGLCMHKMSSKQQPGPAFNAASSTIAGSLPQQEPVAVPSPVATSYQDNAGH